MVARYCAKSMPLCRRSWSGAVGRKPVVWKLAAMLVHTSPCLNLTYFSTKVSVARSTASSPALAVAKPTRFSTAKTLRSLPSVPTALVIMRSSSLVPRSRKPYCT